MKNKFVICVCLAMFFQAWPVLHGLYDAKSSVLFSDTVENIGPKLQKEFFPSMTGTYKLEFFFDEKDPSKVIQSPAFTWNFGSQGKDLSQGQGPANFELNQGQIYRIEVNTSAFDGLTKQQREKSYLRFAFDQEQILKKASDRYSLGTVLSIFFAAAAYLFWRKSRPLVVKGS